MLELKMNCTTASYELVNRLNFYEQKKINDAMKASAVPRDFFGYTSTCTGTSNLTKISGSALLDRLKKTVAPFSCFVMPNN